MKKRCMGFFLAGAMSLSLLPVGALAQEEASAEPAETLIEEPVATETGEEIFFSILEDEDQTSDLDTPGEEALAEEETDPALDEQSVTGTYRQTEARSMLAMINSFRTGSDAWYWNSDDSTKTVYNTTGGTYLPELTYDYNLEQIAMQRAMEIAVSFSHTRPNGQSCFTVTYNGTQTWAENIAAGYQSASSVFKAWQETSETYANQGHRRNMLREDYTAVGIAAFTYNGCTYWVQEFGYANSGASQTTANDGRTTGEVDTTTDTTTGNAEPDNYPEDTVYYGGCGDNVDWTLSDSGVLHIYGSGDMADGSIWYENDLQGMVTSIVIDEGVTAVGVCAFYDFENVTAVSLPSSLTKIGEAAFAYCFSLPSVTLPEGVTVIGADTFLGCESLKSITLPSKLTTIGEGAFLESGLTEITLPETVTQVGAYAFAGCQLTSITIRNKQCVIGVSSEDSDDIISQYYDPGTALGTPGVTQVKGYEGSTAQSYAATYGYTFGALNQTNAGKVLLGDVDGSGAVDIKDVTLLFQYVNHMVSTMKNADAADVNGDGVPDLKDVTKLFQYVNKQISVL